MAILVSVIVPVYNAERFISKCVSSILDSTYKNFELILVDDGSTDNSPIICNQFAKKDKRVIIIHKQNEGVSRARIDGVKNSKGEYISFVDADDYLSKDYIKSLVKSTTKYNADISICQHYDVINEELRQLKRKDIGCYNREQIESLLKENVLYDKECGCSGLPLFLWGKIYKRSIILSALDKGVGFKYGEDMIINFDILFNHANKISVIPDCLYYYVHHTQQATQKPIEVLWEQYTKLWEHIQKADTKGYFKEQLPNRIMAFIYSSLYRVLKTSLSYKHFQKHISCFRNTEIIKDVIFNRNLNESFQHNKLYTLLKYKLYIIAYLYCLYINGYLNTNKLFHQQ